MWQASCAVNHLKISRTIEGEKQMKDHKKIKILFLCTGNSCRSQMAEGWTRKLKGDQIEAYSAGVAPSTIDPRAVKVMAEAGVDISGQKSKDIDEFLGIQFDYVVTLCDHANESCPIFPGKTKRVHRGFDDPPVLPAGAPDEDTAMGHYRRVRDEIRLFVEGLPDNIEKDTH
jgi:arsenate reductase (thioredoxin)